YSFCSIFWYMDMKQLKYTNTKPLIHDFDHVSLPVVADTEVSCIFMERCMLPCSYGGSDVVIHWIQVSAGDLIVHSFYHNKDQLEHQNQRFRGRTSLSSDQISTGNASLQLTKVEVRDEGKYRCYTSTIDGNKESFINLKIDAPVQKVNIQQTGNQMTCSSEGLYPKPNLTWTTSPPSNMSLQYKTTAQETQQLLYNINSSLMVSERVKDLDYSCTISTHRNRKRATLSRACEYSMLLVMMTPAPILIFGPKGRTSTQRDS
uniref:Ig-like domain-containing protein n=1 Tax=Haplochromis burtoni TaxID=8153 RepID=A0A3Q2X507_HAPBU